LKSPAVARSFAAAMCVAVTPWLVGAASAASAHITSRTRPSRIASKAVRPVDQNRGGIDISSVTKQGLSPDVLRLALGAVSCAIGSGAVEPPRTLTLIDYSRPSIEPRLWVFDYNSGELLFHELVAHGRNTGENMATHFSDAMNSRASSLGLFATRDAYVGSNGYSLHLDGLEPGFNGRARERAIVMHGAPYVDAELGASHGRIGRSWGCPALSPRVARSIIDAIRGSGVIFSYYPDQEWLNGSRFLNDCARPLQASQVSSAH
jgi:hypothetical protein